MYSNLPNLIIGFHGCDKTTYENVLYKHEHLIASHNSYDWLDILLILCIIIITDSNICSVEALIKSDWIWDRVKTHRFCISSHIRPRVRDRNTVYMGT